jgi:short-subunit dehydrogenase
MSWALVTGASAGIGNSLSRCFARHGHSVVVVARRRAQLEDLSKELTSEYPGVKVEVVVEDLTSPGAASRIHAQLKQRGIEIEYLVNNAGFGSAGSFNELSLERELQMIDLNIRVLVELTGLLLPDMVRRGSGRILNVGSTAGFQPGPYMATYYASKAFVNSFSEALSEELRDAGVSVTVLAPGPVATEFGKVANTFGSKRFEKIAASSDEVAEYGYASMMRGHAVAIHDFKFKFLVAMNRFTPRSIVRKVVGNFNRSAASRN